MIALEWITAPTLLGSCGAQGLWKPRPFNMNIFSVRSRSNCPCCPSMKDDGIYPSFVLLALPHFNWIETAPHGFDQHGHWSCLCLNHFSTSSLAYCLSDKDKAASGQALSLQNRFAIWALSHSVVLFFFFFFLPFFESRALMRQYIKKK